MTGPNLHLDSSLGSFLVGLMLSTMLYITSSTTVKTSGFSKYWTLDTMVTAADIQFIWKLVVTNHASPSTLFPLARYFLIVTDIVYASASCKLRKLSLVCKLTHDHVGERRLVYCHLC
ncbi:hypothetical protein POSPLADRAFT_1152961 [Postia placenta MAD-698-R-SB12]|uniref:Uncharacterized protein n=1 Tax=Postia placenta MAD-698-R-SB12 TaxID=670580 RepID=A0A1X6MQC8_9APHY|nr:hypothetical protein POSPLADRAFT_1152961 [Postia placenta MAD-698-R-SB12]OSX58500.1 hypothetical protein POSPLADRAFT_1152961 [Postia placenta MAD-698-R-SB12]